MNHYTFHVAKDGYFDVLDLKVSGDSFAEALGKLVRALATIEGGKLICHGYSADE
jgi:hypothetical protein